MTKKKEQNGHLYRQFLQLLGMLVEVWEYFLQQNRKGCLCVNALQHSGFGIAKLFLTIQVQDVILSLPHRYTGNATILPNTAQNF